MMAYAMARRTNEIGIRMALGGERRKIVWMVLRFFFSSGRRHTRWNCDWSSDVCSSDLDDGIGRAAHRHMDLDGVVEGCGGQDPVEGERLPHHVDDAAADDGAHARMARIGRW